MVTQMTAVIHVVINDNYIVDNEKMHDFISSGNLITRYLGDIVKKEDFVLDSEYLVTLLVVVQK